jgi:plasmid stabilization system protein ParE
MTVRYTRRALSDLSRILDYLDERSPRGALNSSREIGTILPHIFSI